jgi:S1-C subfamily serine protease|nr:PDZ domain-containing protein [Kofleriaceae bacterium]
MSVDEIDPSEKQELKPVLRREALLPSERNRGLGTVAVVCTMAGVASGLALATTLMAMQVADSMQTRASCPYSHRSARVDTTDHGFLGIRYVFHDGAAEVTSVLPGTPAEQVSLHRGDRVLAVDGTPIDSLIELQDRIFGLRPGAQPSIVIERDGAEQTVQPTLISWSSFEY